MDKFVFDKYRNFLNISVIVLSITSIIVAIISFLDMTIIDNLISIFAKNNSFLLMFTSFVTVLFISIYSYFITKIFKRKKISIFLSYMHSDKEDINKIKKILSSTNNYKIYDFDSILIGQNIQVEIKNMIDSSSLIIILFNENYFQSNHCLIELEEIVNSGKIIIPILKSSEYVSNLPPDIKKFKYLIISDDEAWESTFKQSLYELYRQVRENKQKDYAKVTDA
jgi:hypothetical protein